MTLLNVIEGADYIALFDVDSRPNIDFLTECVRALTEASNGVLASGCRFVTNKENTLTKIVSIEYKFFCDIYRLGRWSGGFIQFNGLIGVSKAAFLRSTVFDERCACEDVDISQQIYLSGSSALLVNSKVGEQAPTSIQDLYNQRVRWFRGGSRRTAKIFRPDVNSKRADRSKNHVVLLAHSPIFFLLAGTFCSVILTCNKGRK